MKQKVNLELVFSDLSRDFELDHAHEIDGKLIVVGNILLTGCHGEAIKTTSKSAVIDTSFDHELPVKFYLITPNERSPQSIGMQGMTLALGLEEYQKDVFVVDKLERIPELNGLGSVPLCQFKNLENVCIKTNSKKPTVSVSGPGFTLFEIYANPIPERNVFDVMDRECEKLRNIIASRS